MPTNLRVAFWIVQTLLFCSFAGFFSASSHAAEGNDVRDPAAVFDELAQQRDALAADAEQAGAQVIDLPSGGFDIRNPDSSRGTWHNGARRPLEPSSIRFDATDGSVVFSFSGYGDVRFVPVAREVPSLIRHDQNAVTAYDIDHKLDEFTVASHALLEQHLVVASEFANNKVIEYSYTVVPPLGAIVEFGEGQLVVRQGDQMLVAMRADYAIDEAGQRYPAALSFDEANSIATVTYDGRPVQPTGDVAIDPVWLSESSIGVFVMKICQGPPGSVCDVQPLCAAAPTDPCHGDGLPPGVGSLTHAGFQAGATPQWGMYVSALGGSVASGGFGRLIYTPPADTDIYKVAFHGRIDDATRQFSCRTELLKGGSVHGEPGPWFTVDHDQTRRIIQTEAVAPVENGVRQFAEQAALRFQLTGGAVTIGNDHSSKCWMPDATVDANGDAIADRFSAFIHDKVAPTVSASPDLENPHTDALQVVSGVTGTAPANWSTNDHQYKTNRWYRNGSKVTFAFYGEDRGSGLFGFRVRHVSENGPTNTMGTIGTCPVAAHNTSQAPCPLKPGLTFGTGFVNAGNSPHQGLNPYWVVAEDFSGRTQRAGAMFYLFDSLPPTNPTPSTGAVSESDAPVIDANTSVRLAWSGATDPGEAPTGRRTGSGISYYVAQIEWKQNGQWVPYTANADVVAGDTDPATLAVPPTHVDIDAKTGLFRYRVRSIDRAGNDAGWSEDGGHRYFWIDTTEPEMRMTHPTVGFEVDVRMPGQTPKLSFALADPVAGSKTDPLIDRAGVEFRLDGSSEWTQHVDRVGQPPAPFSSEKTFKLSGFYDVRGFAHDGVHHALTGQAQVCADTSIAPSDTLERAVGGEYFPFFDSGVQYATRIRFTAPASAVKTRAWIIERNDGSDDPWRLVRRIGHRAGEQIIVDDWTPVTGPTEWRISPAVLDCTDEGHAAIAEPVREGDGVLDPPTRSQSATLLGLERHWSFHELPLGGGSSSYTNIATGNLVVQRTLLSEAGRGLSTNVDLTYNSHQYGDDEQLARDGVVGAHFTLAIGNSASAATTGGLHVDDASITLRDGDGTPLVFRRPASGWDGYFEAPKGVRMLARDISALPAGHADKADDGLEGTRFKITRPDGVTYYYGDDDVRDPQASAGLRRGRLIGVRDREGSRLRFVYECVAVADLAGSGVSVTPLVKEGSVWKASTSPSGTQTKSCPAMNVPVSGIPSSSVRRMRLVEVRDPAWTASNGREVVVTYRDESGPLDGHVDEIRGHQSAGARRVRFGYRVERGTVQLVSLAEIARDGSQRSIDLAYDASVDDPFDWFDDDVLLKSVEDLRGNITRFQYTVPDGAGVTFANPRVALIENRADVAARDERGVIFRYTTDVDGMLAGHTRVDDQLDRRTTYDWAASLDAPTAFGRVTSSLEPSGLRTNVSWNGDNQVTRVRLAADPVVHEPVLIVGIGGAMVRNGAIDPSAPLRILRAGTGFDVTDQYVIDWNSGTIRRGPGAPTDDHAVLISYTPSSARSADSHYNYDPVNGRVTRVTGDQRWIETPDGTTRGNVAGALGVPTWHDSPITTLAYTPSAGPSRVASFVKDLHEVRTPLGQPSGGHDTTLTVDASSGRVQVVHAPFDDGSRKAPTDSSYYANGNLRSSTDAQGWTIAYWDYDEAGRAQHVSRRVNAGSIAGFGSATTEGQVAALKLPEAFHVDYDADGQATCVRDLREGQVRGNRFATYTYDGFGRLIAETSPFRTDEDRGRLRRLTTHSYDANGNRIRSVRNRLYYLPGSDGSAADCEHVPSNPDGGVSVPGGKPDAEYDRLDRVVVERLLSNSDANEEREKTTFYNRAGDVDRIVEPLGNATATAHDYSTRLFYDGAGRVRERIDGEDRRTCLYYDAWSNVVLETSPRFQRKAACPDAADQGRSVRRAFDNAGQVVWEQQPSGHTTLTLYDAEGNPAQTRVKQRERSGTQGVLGPETTRITRSTYGAGGVLIEQQAPHRAVCTKAGLSACGATGRVSAAPRHTWTYNELGRLVQERLPRQLGEVGAGDSQPITYQYDQDGNRIAEITPHGDGAGEVTAVYTTYDGFGNPSSVTTPVPRNMSSGALRTKFTTSFTYQDDDSPKSKRDRAHDNEVSWQYERNGQMSVRIEEDLDADPDDEWRTVQRYSFYDDGSLRTAPYTVQAFQANAHYVSGTCIRAGGSNASTPTHVYEVASPKRVARAKGAPDWGDPSWGVGGVRWSGEVRLIKRTFASGALHTYDENGQPASVVGCGVRTDWLERNGTGQLTVARDIHDGFVNYRYGSGGELLDERVGERIYRSAYVEPDSDPMTIDPGAGRVSISQVLTPSENSSELRLGYLYALDGNVDQVHRHRRGRYAGKFAVADEIVSTTSYDYDSAGQLESHSSIRYAAATASKRSTKAAKAKRGVRGSGTSQLVFRQQLTRDLAGNARWIEETQRMAESATVGKIRTREKLYAYDLAQRMVQDRVGTSPVRTYSHDEHGRLETVRTSSAFLDRYFYDDGTRSLGVMLPVRQQSRDDLADPLKLTVLKYGNGRREDVGSTEAGPRGQLVTSTRYKGLDATTGVEHVTQYAFTSLNQLARATDTAYEVMPGKGRARRVRVNGKVPMVRRKVSKAQSLQSEWTHYDLLGRRAALIQSADDPTNAAAATYTSTAMIYAGANQDPFAEHSTNPNDPDVRWIHRVDGAIVGEVRNSRSRYMIADQQGSTVATLDGAPTSPITATFDFSAYGKPKDPAALVQGPRVKNPVVDTESFASGLAKERGENSYSYTGMRQNAVGGTTHHHARDYNASVRGWLQTDQYMDPWSDLGLSMDPTTRDRHVYAGANPISNVDTDGHRFTSDVSDRNAQQWMPTSRGVWRGSGGCNCTSFESNSSGTSSWVSYGGNRYSGTGQQVRAVVKKVAAVETKMTEFRGTQRMLAAQSLEEVNDLDYIGLGAGIIKAAAKQGWRKALKGGGAGAGKELAEAQAAQAARYSDELLDDVWENSPLLRHVGDDVFEASGGEQGALRVFAEATRGGTRISKPGYRGEQAYSVNGRFVGFRYNDDGVPTIDYGRAPGAERFRVHFPEDW